MRSFLLSLVVLTVAAAGAAAQQAQPVTVPLRPDGQNVRSADRPLGIQADPIDTTYVWKTWFYYRDEGQGDENRTNLPMPFALPPNYATEIRGAGEIIDPTSYYQLYYGSVFGPNTNVDPLFSNGQVADTDYINQFKDAHAFTLEEIDMAFFLNLGLWKTGGFANYPGRFVVYSVPLDLLGSDYRTHGFNVPMSTLEDNIVYDTDIDLEGFDSTLFVSDQGDTLFRRTAFTFDPPLTFDDQHVAVAMFQTLAAPALTPDQLTGNAEYQQVPAHHEVKPGTLDTLTAYKVLSVILEHTNSPTVGDTVSSSWLRLSLSNSTTQTSWPFRYDYDMLTFGRVEIQAGVEYYFGVDATSQGLGAVAPNPVTVSTTVPFSLTEPVAVTLDLFDAGGRHVRTLADGRFLPGKYTAELPTTGLANGAYLLRMTAGGKVYTQKVIVAR